MRKRAFVSVSLLALAAIACSAAGCGGDDSTSFTPADGGGDGTTSDGSQPVPGSDSGADTTLPDAPDDTTSSSDAKDSATNDAHDGATNDAGDAGNTDASDSGADSGIDAGCTGTNTACGTGGLCKNGTCATCIDPGDDALCTSAYASDGGASSYICLAGACTAGDCHSSATCAGKICGAAQPNFCGSCTTDTQCKADATYGAATVCNTALGTCVSSTCAVPNQVCPVNAADFCCASGGGTTCVAGNCCTNAQCAPNVPACQSNVCTACGPIVNGTYFVDPVNGSDTLANGSGMAGGVVNGVCAFKTVAKAIAVVSAISGGPPANTKIVVLGPNAVSTALTGEAFPWIVPVNTVLSSQGGVITAVVTAGVDGVRLTKPSSGIQGFILDGQGNTAIHGILVQSGSSPATTTVRAVTIRNFLDAGIRVEGTGSGVAIGAGTSSTGNGIVAAPRPGLRVTDSGVVAISSTTDTIAFNSNTGHGIEVDLQASVTITGTPGATLGTGTVVANLNGSAGLSVVQTPSNGVPPINTVMGLVAFQNTGGGAHARGGSNVKVRGSRFVSNAIGVNIQPFGSIDPWNDDTSRIDFGQSAVADPGRNVVQQLAGSGQNTSIGVCYGINPNKNQTLYMYGNTWVSNGASVDCTTSTATLTRSSNCSGGGDLGGSGLVNNTVGIAGCL